jgi:hypothetical protein
MLGLVATGIETRQPSRSWPVFAERDKALLHEVDPNLG